MTFDDGLPTADHIWALWSRGVADRRSPFRTPTLATVGTDGRPEVRTVVLREATRAQRQLVLHSDIRGAKIAALSANAALAWHFWNPRHRLQLRATGSATMHHSDAVSNSAWERLSPMQQRTYSMTEPPGSPLETEGDGLPDAVVKDAGRQNFCVVVSRIEHIDVLQLRRGGHRRCALTWSGTAWSAQWLIP